MTPLLLYSFFPAHVPRALTYSSCFLPYFRSHEAKPRSFNKDQRWRPVPSFIIRNTISTRQREMPCVCVCVSYKCGKTGELLEETWAAKKSEGQDMRAEGGIKRRVGCRMVARVTVRVATPYVNPPIWSILQSKRIGFLWRWISSAGKLFLPLSLSLTSSTCSTSRSDFFSSSYCDSMCDFSADWLPLLSLPSQPHHDGVYSATSGSTWSLVIFSKCQFVSHT